MSKIKLQVVKDSNTPDSYAEGEYKADLTKSTVEVHPVFGERLITLGYAKRSKEDELPKPKQPENAPRFVEREVPEITEAQLLTQTEAAAVPTEELTMEPADNTPAKPRKGAK